jgi:hypothetical protein
VARNQRGLARSNSVCRVRLRTVVLAVLVTLLWAAPGGAQAPLTPTEEPLAGSGFQAGDGDQDETSTLSDWQPPAVGPVVHTADANDDDSAFKAGETAKEDRPGDWALATEPGGVVPGKANIRDAWGTVDQRNGRTFLFLAFSRDDRERRRRETQRGTTFLAFELNRRALLWDNDNNDATARVPCRTDGDVLISFEPRGDDEVVDVLVHRWVTETWDQRTSCARTGHLSDPATALVPNVDVQGALNGDAIKNWLGGAFDPIEAGLFGEAGIDLATVLAEAFDDPCLTYTSVWMHSHSSVAEQANMQDYVAPRRLMVRTCAASGTKFFDSDADGARDPGEPGVPWFVIFADYNNDGVRDADEPFTLTGPDGRYVLDHIRPPSGSYLLRETALVARRRGLPVSENWICSFPNASTTGGTASAPDGRFGCGWGPINSAQEPHARGRDFGNWFPEPPTPPTPEPLTPATPDDNLAPPGPPPPAAGTAGVAGVSRSRGCLRRGSVVTVRGSRIASIRVSVGGERVRGLSVRPEQRLARIRLTRNFAPGRYRVTARVAFQRGSGTPRAVLHRTVRICAPARPRFTG